MAIETLYPDAIITQTGLSGALSTINSAPDGTWMLHSAPSGELRVSFPSPSGTLNTGAGIQEFHLYLRKDATGGGDPDITVELYENGTLRQTLVSNPGSTVTSATGEDFTDVWDAANLVGDGSGVELRVVTTKGGGGPNERSVEIDSISWVVDYTAVAPEVDSGPVSGSGAGTSSATGTRVVVGTSTAAGIGAGSAAAINTALGDATGNGTGSGTSTGLLTSFGVGSSPGVGTSSSTATLIIPALALTSAGVGTASASGATEKLGSASGSGVGTSSVAASVISILSFSFTPNGTVSSSGLVNEGGGSTNLHLSLDESFGLEDDDSTYVVNSGRADGTLTMDLSGVPGDYDSMETLTVRLRVRSE